MTSHERLSYNYGHVLPTLTGFTHNMRAVDQCACFKALPYHSTHRHDSLCIMHSTSFQYATSRTKLLFLTKSDWKHRLETRDTMSFWLQIRFFITSCTRIVHSIILIALIITISGWLFVKTLLRFWAVVPAIFRAQHSLLPLTETQSPSR